MESKSFQAVRRIALAYPETEEGVTCDKSSFKSRGKAFVFLCHDDGCYTVMLKLSESLPEAAELAAAHPTNYKVGGHNWVTATYPHAQTAPRGLLERWIEESFRLLAPKQLVAQLPVVKNEPSNVKTAVKKRARRKAKK